MANTDTNADTTDIAGGLTGASADKGAGAKDVKAPGQDGSKGGLTGGDAKVESETVAKAAVDKAASDKLAADNAKNVEVKFGALQVDPKFSDKFKGVAKEIGLDSAKAQKVSPGGSTSPSSEIAVSSARR